MSGSKYCGFSDRYGVSEEDGVHVRGYACQRHRSEVTAYLNP